MSNAVEHGLPQGGPVTVHAERSGASLSIDVVDDGVGIDSDGPGGGLGTSIVRTLVGGDLSGSISWENGTNGGTCVHLDVKVQEPGR